MGKTFGSGDSTTQKKASSSTDSTKLPLAGGTLTGDLAVTGTTPTITVGDAGAEDTKIVFDGNAQDFYVGLDDSADDLIIGLGSAVGTTPIISVDENKDVSIPDGGLTITTSDNTNTLKLISTDADATNDQDLPPPGLPNMRPKSPFPNPPCSKLLIFSQGVGTVVLEFSLYLSSISLTYSCPTFLSCPALKAPSTIYLIPSKSPAFNKSTDDIKAFFNCWFRKLAI